MNVEKAFWPIFCVRGGILAAKRPEVIPGREFSFSLDEGMAFQPFCTFFVDKNVRKNLNCRKVR